jgi:antitoxin component YwqK of YwqJK toxin-antitoxin module
MRTVIGASYKKWTEPVEDTSTRSEESDTLSSLDQFLIKNFQGNLNTKYYPNGNPKASIEMDGNVRDGVYVEFYENGTASVKGKYKDGLKHGLWKYYNPDGSFKNKERYVNGELTKQNLIERILGLPADEPTVD